MWFGQKTDDVIAVNPKWSMDYVGDDILRYSNLQHRAR